MARRQLEEEANRLRGGLQEAGEGRRLAEECWRWGRGGGRRKVD